MRLVGTMNSLTVRRAPESSRLLVILLLAFAAFAMAFGNAGIAHADGDSADMSNVVDLGSGNATAGAIATQINSATGTTIMSYSVNTGVFTFKNSEYALLTVQEKREYMSDALGYIKTSSLSTKEKNRLYNFVADQDGTTSSAIRNLKVDSQADLATAASWYKPFSGIVSTLLGVLALGVFLFLGISVVVDIAYMVIPFIRIFISKGDEKKPYMVSNEAYTSVIEAEDSAGDGHFKSYMVLYLQRRVGVLLLIGFCLFYLVSGQIFDLVAFIVDAISPLTDQLSGK